MDLPENIIFDGISLLVIIIDIILTYIIAVKSYNMYKMKKSYQTKLFSIASYLTATAMIFLITEKIFFLLSDTPNDLFANIGMWVISPIAISISGIAIMVIVAFASNMAFPKRYKTLTIIAAVFICIYIGFHIFDPYKYVGGDEIIFDPWPMIGVSVTQWIIFGVLMPIIIFPVFLFFYYAIKIRSKSQIRFKRSVLMGLAGIFLALGYLFELVGLPPYISAITRSFFLVSGILFYWALFKLKED
ncbi:MAG: hypothetical protein GF329_16485 [Candidatus Lokiarchaeota archaeon]|nr:hypothetical protein [Candidatus Lokiarchaeota archaeon]